MFAKIRKQKMESDDDLPGEPPEVDRSRRSRTLCDCCFRAVRRHFAALGSQAVLDLPVPLLTDLLPHLTVCQLDELQPALNRKGVSTYSGWLGILQQCLGHNNVADLRTEEEAKHAVMRQFFQLVFYGSRNHYTDLDITHFNTSAFLLTAAKCLQQFVLISSRSTALQSLTAEQRPLLNLLEKKVISVSITQCFDPSDRKKQKTLLILHRLLDHGMATQLVLHGQSPRGLAWLLHGRGTQLESLVLRKVMLSSKENDIPLGATTASPGGEDAIAPDEQVVPHKRSKLDCACVGEEELGSSAEAVQHLCGSFSPSDPSSAPACPRGKILSLIMKHCDSDSLSVLNVALPKFFSLRSLTLNSSSIFRDSDVLDLATALKQLCGSFHTSFCHLAISVLPHTSLIQTLLDSTPNVLSLQVEVQTVMWGMQISPHHPRTDASDLSAPSQREDFPSYLFSSERSLQKLVITVAEPQTDLRCITSVLRRCPHLRCLHLAGMRLPTGSSLSPLLRTLSVSNRSLTTLHLQDLKLSDCFTHILHLLTDCKLKELQLNDCRLLEACDDKAASLQQLVEAVKKTPSLHTLSLPHNRLAQNVYILAELFSGSSPSCVKHLNISSNFIQAAELLQFAERLRTHRPPHRLTLDLRRNPADRDPDTWSAALSTLSPFSHLLVEGWKSTDTMLDHVSNM